jgi:hypothetical protein
MTFLSCDCCGDLPCRKPEAAIEDQASKVRFYGSTIFASLVLNWAVLQLLKANRKRASRLWFQTDLTVE